MSGIIGRKIGMTSVYQCHWTKCSMHGNRSWSLCVTQVKNEETDGYKAVQLAYGEAKEKHVPKALLGHFKKANTTPKRELVEFRDFRMEFDGEIQLGQEIRVGDVFVEGDFR